MLQVDLPIASLIRFEDSPIDRKNQLSTVTTAQCMNVRLNHGFGTRKDITSETYLFVKNFWNDNEDHESRVDMLVDVATGELLVQKEYLIEESVDLTPTQFTTKVENELDTIYNHLTPHPNICPLLGWFRGGYPEGREDPSHKTSFTLIMPWIRSDPPPLSADYIRNWASSTLAALTHLHNNNLICTNLKPDCMMYDSSKGFLMIDWGDFQIDHKRYPYEENGSGMFMAPEMPSGRFDNKVDSYSLGIILAQMCLGDADIFRNFGTLTKTERLSFWERLKNRKPEDNYYFWQSYAYQGLCQFWTEDLVNLITALTEFNPEQRLSCEDAQNHSYFKERELYYL